MTSTIVIAVAATANLFLSQFGGTWTCGNDRYHAAWTIAQAPGESTWATVTYGPPSHPGGSAFVGWLAQEQHYVYEDFHSDGSFARLSAAPPKDGIWTWTGDYFPQGGNKDSDAVITWTLTPDGSIARRFAKRTPTGLEDRGSDHCTRTSPSQ